MLFNSPFFILFFLPFTLAIYWIFRSKGKESTAVNALIIASFLFYAWWDVRYVALIGGGILFNYCICKQILKKSETHKKLLLFLGVATNLGILGYFKYTDFLIQQTNSFLGTHYPLLNIVLPLGISFFIFQKIAFLVDAYRGEFQKISLQQFTAFVIFFPQLIAGPIPRHNELFVQFKKGETPPLDWENMALGISSFSIGLFKKTVIADRLAMYSSPMFINAADGIFPDFSSAWIGTLGFTFQLYFDFSGYSDMAIGLALLFGYHLPINFFSPYKANSIIDFWRRWHITLSRFLKDYLYIPLGGNRHGVERQKINLMITMLLGGFWHGASWTFVIWGLLHGLFLCINHLWWELKERLGLEGKLGALGPIAGRLLTFLSVTFAWVFFKADNLPAAYEICASLLGFRGFYFNISASTLLLFLALFTWVWAFPNSYEYLGSKKTSILTYQEPLDNRKKTDLPIVQKLKKLLFYWQTNLIHAAFISGLVVLSTLHFIRSSEFLYFQF